jgi:hypothetical protein
VREEHRLRMCENRALRRIFCPKREKVEGDRRTLHNESIITYTLHQMLSG